MNRSEYKNFYDKVGIINGWDFSKLKTVSEGEPWDFYYEVTQKCNKHDLLLDIGTGGGEALLSIAAAALLLVGIDNSTGMIQTAYNNLDESTKTNIRFLQMDAENISFPELFFNIVSCRHSEFFAKEVSKILVNDGVFLTQQVSEAGFNSIQYYEFDATEYFQTYKDLVFFLKYTPVIPDFGQNPNDFDILQKFIEANQTEKGIRTNSKRFMSVAKK